MLITPLAGRITSCRVSTDIHCQRAFQLATRPIIARGPATRANNLIVSRRASSHTTPRPRMTQTPHATIISQVDERFDKAREAGDLLFFPSTIYQHEEAGIEFQIRLCPALQNKPKLPAPHFDTDDTTSALQHAAHKGDKKPDPFASPYNPNLFIGELRDEEEGEEFAILLNKYSVVPNHFLMVTKEYKSQSSPLYPVDLVHAYLFIDAARISGKEIFAFYNCGDVSGASQPHKHLQFLPIESDGPPIEKLTRTVKLESDSKPFTLNLFPFATHVRRLPVLSASTPRPQLEETLGEAFMSLLDLAISTVRHDPSHPVGQPSYNVILTRQHMYIVPRRREEHVLRETGDVISLNALAFAGLLLVKSENELKAVKKESVVEILKDVGLRNVHDKQIVGEHDVDA